MAAAAALQDVKDEAANLIEYVTKPGEEAAKRIWTHEEPDQHWSRDGQRLFLFGHDGGVTRVDLAARTTRPLWISIDVPREALPGRYSGELKVLFQGGSAASLRLNLDVQGAVRALDQAAGVQGERLDLRRREVRRQHLAESVVQAGEIVALVVQVAGKKGGI